MRKWTMSACVVLAWCVLPLTAMAGFRTSGPSHASGSSAASISTVTSIGTARSTTPVILASESVTAKAARAARPAQRPAVWTVRPGDSLTAIATALGVPGGWQALYAANRNVIGPNPNFIDVGTMLTLPGAAGSTRYTVGPGDSLSGIATALSVPGGWQALYAANRNVIGPNPDVIRPGIILATPTQATRRTHGQPPMSPTTTQAPPRHSVAPVPVKPSKGPSKGPSMGPSMPPSKAPTGNVGSTSSARPSQLTAPSARAGGMPRWLEDVLLAAGVLAVTAFAAEPAAAIARRRKAAGKAPANAPINGNGSATRLGKATVPVPGAWSVPRPRGPRHRQTGNTGDLAKQAAAKARIILADHERLIVTYSVRDHTVYVLTPPGEDPMVVLAAARLVLPEDTYKDLAGHLGVPAIWPPE